MYARCVSPALPHPSQARSPLLPLAPNIDVVPCSN
jgi:hypothetical protein